MDKIEWEYERVYLDADGVCDMKAFATLIGSETKFNTPVRHCPVVTDEIKEIIRKCLEEKNGTGKTHIATALGIEACAHGITVMFTSVPRLITQIIEARQERSLRSFENRFLNCDLVICL